MKFLTNERKPNMIPQTGLMAKLMAKIRDNVDKTDTFHSISHKYGDITVTMESGKYFRIYSDTGECIMRKTWRHRTETTL